MTERVSLLKALANSGSSKVIQKLTPDQTIPTISKAIELIENHDPTDKERVEKFHTPRYVSSGSHFSFTTPMKRSHYKPILVSKETLENDFQLDIENDPLIPKILSGEKIYYDEDKSIFPYSLAYAGYQFGSFAGQLGDGRVVNLFDYMNHTFQLKGSGKTPFSRFADGKAVLRSSIREFIISEALYNIGIPSTRAVQLTLLPGTKAIRDGSEPCALVCRVAPSWIRFGSFDLFKWKPNLVGLIKLTDYCIEDVFHNGEGFPKDIDLAKFNKDYFPDSKDEENISSSSLHEEKQDQEQKEGLTNYDQFFRHVVNLNAECVAYWQAYGFCNGVLNTDNTSIMGISLDYGPFSFLDKFEPDFTPNHDDYTKRYSFANQPSVIWWNLIQLAQDIAVLLGAGPKHINDILQMQNGEDIDKFDDDLEKEFVNRANNMIRLCSSEYKYRFTTKYADLMGKRLGIDLDLPKKLTNDVDLDKLSIEIQEFSTFIIDPLLEILQHTKIDYNNFFVNLQSYDGPFFVNDEGNLFNGLDEDFIKIFFKDEEMRKIKEFYEKASGDLNRTTSRDSGETRFLIRTMDKLKEWCISYCRLVPDAEIRKSVAKKKNPLFIPRSWIFEEVIDNLTLEQREKLDYPEADLDTSLLQKLHLMSLHPYDNTEWDDNLRAEVVERWTTLKHASRDDKNKFMKQLSCSS
ncbi:Fmp40p NDAI_0F01450 [Naumovozyma dairenensis CBS 421]|uniref:Selenoprotein O n=1 Tax=Naumovozyma dairenensis (strain ATCC 10597 / BCRC 20456 / CBS 421 / NBRC 0211 / NRRL Y-12639) TaxID=1071378 RepID=G0WCF3_NAUDC|nr:hypothetical protein NDAI_0F01450 [Naumovozyma dairenensis CBS 421]CCD25464.1 hypothetical protein NDAI_0F01450 [Naumovozyma dairenensis CBS 421]